MASTRGHEHFALDWIKSDLVETLNQARVALDEYAEQGADETRLRACLTHLHQLHGTLQMLELSGITLLSDHLEQAAQALMLESVAEPVALSQILMQGILEMPGYLEELQRGAEDQAGAFLPLVNDIRSQLGQPALEDQAGKSLNEGASDDSVAHFQKLKGQETVARIRSAYQGVLLSILKGEERSGSIDTLSKIASGLQKLTVGSSMERQWQAFGEFVQSLAGNDGALESDAVKLLRKVDIEIKTLASDGEAALRKPANVELVQQLLDAAGREGYQSETVDGLKAAVERDTGPNTLAISGRQALATAAVALRDELSIIKDKLDLLARGASLDLDALQALIAPLGQIGSTLSLLGFESSQAIVREQIDVLKNIVVLGDSDTAGIQSVAAALVQIDENLNSVSNERSEVEQITSEAQLQLLREANKGLDAIKLSIVDFVTAHWDVRHLEEVPATLNSIVGALDIVGLPRVTALLATIGQYVEGALLAGHRPDWQELDRFADVISGIDYYLERLAEENTVGMDDILELAEKSLMSLQLAETDSEASQLEEQVAEEQVAESTAEAAEEVAEEASESEELLDIPVSGFSVAADLAEETDEQADDELAEESAAVEQGDEIEFSLDDESELASEVVDDTSDKAATEEAADAEGEGDVAGLLDNLEFSVEDIEVEAEPDAEALMNADEGEPAIELVDEEAEEPAEDAAIEFVLDQEDEAADEDVAVAAADDEQEPSALEDQTEEASDEYGAIEYEALSADDDSAEVVADLLQAADDDSADEVVAADEALADASAEQLADEADTDTETSEDVALDMEFDDAFDLSSDVFDDIEGVVGDSDEASEAEPAIEAEQDLAAVSDAEVEDAGETAEVAAALSSSQGQAIEFEGDPPDEEIVEIFVEEVGEVVEAIDEWLPQWDLDLGEPLTEVRRAFHTLKGSGRIVQALEIGDLGWGVENMLNRVIDGTVEPNEQFKQVVTSARDLIPSLAASFEQGVVGDRDALAVIIEQADLLASGGQISDADQAENAEQLVEAEDEATEAIASQDTESASMEVDASDVAEPQTDEVEADDFADEIFLGEVADCLAMVREAQAAEPWELSEPLKRALHTLAGSAAAAGSEQVTFIVEPANQVVDVYRSIPAGDEVKAFFDDVLKHLDEAISAYKSESWEAPVEIVAAADDLVADAISRPNPAQRLLDSEATGVLFGSEEAVHAVMTGQQPGTEVLSALTDFVNLAGELDDSVVADLAAVLMHTLTVATVNKGAPKPAQELVAEGFEELLDQLNTLVMGEVPVAKSDLLARLNSIDLTEEAKPQAAEDFGVVDMAEVIKRSESESDAEEVGDEQAAFDLGALDIDDDLVEVFFEEAEEINDELESSILSWSKEQENLLYLENMLRCLHTLKGGARLCGLVHVGDMAHEFESSVIEVQGGQRGVDDDLFKEFHKRFDDIVEALSSIRTQFEGAADEPPAQAEADAPVETVVEPVEAEDTVAESSTEENQFEDLGFVADATAEAAIPAEEPAPKIEPLVRKPAEQPVVEKVDRGQQEMVRVGAGLLEDLVNLAGENSILRARVEQGMSDFTNALDEMETTIERLREQLRRLEIETETQVLYRHERSGEGPAYENFDPLEMDRYSQLQQLSRGLSESASDMLDLKDTLLFKARESETLLLQQARINTELQEGLMRTRMVPFSRLMPRLRRIVRQVAGELDKEVDFQVQNAEGELDRNLLERMVPSLEHMLRNAVDHGIETPEVRRNFGKAQAGRIDLRLSREGGDVVIEISDDGAGIDVESVRAKAVEKGLSSAESPLTDDDAMQFILAAGFSTAKSVTQISGRGVGMDVVHSEVKQLGGSIHISSKLGQGTRFVLRVPFTVSVNRALMVSVTDDLYAIPLNTIEGIVLLNPEEVDALHEKEGGTFEYAGVPYRVRYLGQYLGREYRGVKAGQTSVPVVLVRAGDHAVAIHVDAVQGSREIVVKSLGPQFAGVGGISGATILGDGSVVVILDLHALIRAQRQVGQRATASASSRTSRPRCVMVVDDSVTVRKVTSRLLERQGMDVVVAKDGVEAVALLQERRPDVMLLDIEMPRMDGFEVARQVRHDDRLEELPIVMISSRTGDKHKEHANQLGVNKFLGKPFQENELLATIDELVNRP